MPSLTSRPERPSIRSARSADVTAVERLLIASALPVDGVADLLRDQPGDFVVAEDPREPGELVAVGGLEVRGAFALLRSVAVAAAYRGTGLGEHLVRHLVSLAEGRGIRALYLLTTTAEGWFPRFGFERVARDSVPEEIAGTLEFRSTCPSSAVPMVRRVRSSSAY